MVAKAKSRTLKKNKGHGRPRCGLCGKTRKLTKTECCGQWICDDEDKYIIFSYARNSCSRNHRRFTLCGYHYTEEHEGNWKDCPECRNSFETEIYVYYGTNEYNFRETGKSTGLLADQMCEMWGSDFSGIRWLFNKGWRILVRGMHSQRNGEYPSSNKTLNGGNSLKNRIVPLPHQVLIQLQLHVSASCGIST